MPDSDTRLTRLLRERAAAYVAAGWPGDAAYRQAREEMHRGAGARIRAERQPEPPRVDPEPPPRETNVVIPIDELPTGPRRVANRIKDDPAWTVVAMIGRPAAGGLSWSVRMAHEDGRRAAAVWVQRPDRGVQLDGAWIWRHGGNRLPFRTGLRVMEGKL